jgi:hypothetical protein
MSRFRNLARPRDRDNQSKIRKRQKAPADELPPPLSFGRLLNDCGETGNDENQVPDSADGHHHRFKLVDLTRMQKGPNKNRTRLDEVRSEELQAVPSNRDCEARAIPPRTVAARKNHDGDVYECLEEVKKPKLRNDRRRSCQGDKEEPGSNRNPYTRRRRSIQRMRFHSALVRQGSEKGMHLPQHIGLVGEKYVVMRIRQRDHMRGGYPPPSSLVHLEH